MRASLKAWISNPWVKALGLLSLGGVLGAAAALRFSTDVEEFAEHVRSKIERVFSRAVSAEPVGVNGWVAERGYRQQVHAKGLNYPSTMVFVPNPGADPDSNFYYVAELPGTIKLVTRKGEVRTVADKLLNFKWNPLDELGITGMDIDPAGDRLYLTMTYWDGAAGVYRNKVEALMLAVDGRSSTGRTVLLDMKTESTVASYQIQFLSVGPDDNLYVGVGSGGNKQDAESMAHYAGKILRLTKQGAALPDNPFYDAAAPNGARSYIYALGFRNPFDMVWDPGKKFAIVSDVGPSTDRIARLEKGVNYNFGGGVEGEEMMRSNALFTWGPGGSFAPTGVAIAPDSMFGGGAGQSLFVALFGPVHMPGQTTGKNLLRFELHAGGHIDSGPKAVTRYMGPFYSSLTDIDVGPDGLYALEIYGSGELPHLNEGMVYRITADGQKSAGLAAVAKPQSAEELFASCGCIACHDVRDERSSKEGPSLHKVGDRLDARINSADYNALLANLMQREETYYVDRRAEYRTLKELSGRRRVREWFRDHLKDPRFDDPKAKMPSFAHLPAETVGKLADWLLGPE